MTANPDIVAAPVQGEFADPEPLDLHRSFGCAGSPWGGPSECSRDFKCEMTVRDRHDADNK